jgi:methyltransferase (TIGR00027 family)
MGKRNKAAETSLLPMMIAAAEDREPDPRLLVDPTAAGMLPPPMRRMLGSAWARRRFRAALDRQEPGTWDSLACRKRYFDDTVAAALDAGAEAMVVLGAGLDTRSARLAVPRGIPAFDVDLPGTVARRERRLPPVAGVRSVPIDFETDDLAATLAAHGYRAQARTVFVWEGVSQYLTEDAVRTTVGALAAAAPGSRLVFSYVLCDFLNGVDLHDADWTHHRFVAVQRLWKFGLDPAGVGAFLAEYGWREREQVGAAEFAERYLRPIGRAGDALRIERCVDAEKV